MLALSIIETRHTLCSDTLHAQGLGLEALVEEPFAGNTPSVAGYRNTALRGRAQHPLNDGRRSLEGPDPGHRNARSYNNTPKSLHRQLATYIMYICIEIPKVCVYMNMSCTL